MEKVFSSGLSSALAGGADTIVARSTPSGRGGLAVVRVSGPATRAVSAAVCPEVAMDRGWRASRVTLRDNAGSVIDHAVALPFPAPRSFTGEDMLEMMVHGSPFVVGAVIDACIAAGARPAEAGEFTRRAVANGKLDLVQAEAINELTSAETALQARMARAQLEGTLSREFAELKGELVELLAIFESALDFAAQELPFDPREVQERCARALGRIRSLLATAPVGSRVRDGVRVAILGPPNSGKSTLFNTLTDSERAIVSPHPGTTRDVVEVVIEVAGVPVVLQDTAGLGVTEDPVEQEGVRRARGAAAGADAMVWLWPADGKGEPTTTACEGQAVLRLRSKWDLAGRDELEDGWSALSCRTGEGVEDARVALARMVAGEVADLGGNAAIAERHRRALVRAEDELDGVWTEAPELAAEAVRNALDAVQELLGEVVTEDILDRIFSRFCVGK